MYVRKNAFLWMSFWKDSKTHLSYLPKFVFNISSYSSRTFSSRSFNKRSQIIPTCRRVNKGCSFNGEDVPDGVPMYNMNKNLIRFRAITEKHHLTEVVSCEYFQCSYKSIFLSSLQHSYFPSLKSGLILSAYNFGKKQQDVCHQI